MEIKKLLEPIKIGNMHIRNRMVMAAIDTHSAFADGYPTDRLLAFIGERAKGGAGLIITGAAFIDNRESKFSHGQLGAYDDSLIAGLNLIAETIQRYGAKAVLQLCHAGMQRFYSHPPLVAASSIPWKAVGIEPRPATKKDIASIIDDFATAAIRARTAGFDAVEVHGAHGYLITNFLSPRTNKRVDEYGGSLQGRMKIAVEIVLRIRDVVGGDYPVLFRLSGEERLPGGIPIEETVVVSKALEAAGVDALHIAGGVHDSMEWEIPPMHMPRACNTKEAQRVKDSVKIPVIVAGGINDPVDAENILCQGKADMVAFARALLADPFLPNKVAKGCTEEVRKCIRCNEGCVRRSGEQKEIRCSINPSAHRERDFELWPAVKAKKILVVGGGPAGLEAARVAAERGHSVFLYEREETLGGMLIPAGRPSFKMELRHFLEYLVSQVCRFNVHVRTGVEVTPSVVKEIEPDTIILGVGAYPRIPPVSGINNDSVSNAVDLLKAEVPPRAERFLVVGGGIIGCETACYLAQLGKQVSITTRREPEALAVDAELSVQRVIRHMIKDLGIEVHNRITLQEFQGESAFFQHEETHQRVSLYADRFVLAVGFVPNQGLLRQLKSGRYEVYAVGDCVAPRRIEQAIHEAANVASII